LGAFTACLGGVFHDVLAGKPSIIIRPELYVTAAIERWLRRIRHLKLKDTTHMRRETSEEEYLAWARARFGAKA
jgi:uncharacterized membrane protein YeiH